MVFSRLRALYSRHPLVCNMGIYGSLYSLGDVSQQTICGKSHIDYLSASRVGAVGAGIFGPFYLFWYRALDKRLPGTAAKIILRKVIVDQSIAGAVGTFVFFTGNLCIFSDCVVDFVVKNLIQWISDKRKHTEHPHGPH